MDYLTLYKILSAILKIIMVIIRGYTFVWFIWIILSWLRAFGAIQIDPYSPLMRTLTMLTDGVIDKVFGNFRRKLVIGVLDLSPFAFLMVLTYIFPPVLEWLFNLLLGFLGKTFY